MEASIEAIYAMALRASPSILTSFYYRNKHAGLSELWVRAMHAASHRMVDSGAYSFLYGAKLAIDFDLYLTKYLSWVRDNSRSGVVDWWVELDLSQILGYDWVHKQRDKMIADGLGAGLITVWHSDADWAYWLYLIEESLRPGRSRYIAIEGHHADREKLDYTKFIAEAYRKGVRVHGFMITGCGDLERWPFYSVDSTTWKSCVIWGGSSSLSRTSTGICHQHVGRGVWLGSVIKDRIPFMLQSIDTWAAYERRITESWVARGVDWSRLDL
jgi:hypothetical protein